MRAADGDRQAVADKLRIALDEGRLDLHEYDERLQQAYVAKTYGELEHLVTDLPAVTVSPPQPVAERVTARWLAHVWSDWGTVVGITVAIWLVSSVSSGEMNYFWPFWVGGPWGIYCLWQTVSGLTTGEPQRWQAKLDKKQAKKELKKQAKRERKALESEQTDD